MLKVIIVYNDDQERIIKDVIKVKKQSNIIEIDTKEQTTYINLEYCYEVNVIKVD